MNGLTGVGTRDQTDERGAGYQGQVLGTHKQLVTLAQTEYDVRVSAGVPSLHTLRMTLDTAAPSPMWPADHRRAFRAHPRLARRKRRARRVPHLH